MDGLGHAIVCHYSRRCSTHNVHVFKKKCRIVTMQPKAGNIAHRQNDVGDKTMMRHET